jgi:hypothetical protein
MLKKLLESSISYVSCLLVLALSTLLGLFVIACMSGNHSNLQHLYYLSPQDNAYPYAFVHVVDDAWHVCQVLRMHKFMVIVLFSIKPFWFNANLWRSYNRCLLEEEECNMHSTTTQMCQQRGFTCWWHL